MVVTGAASSRISLIYITQSADMICRRVPATKRVLSLVPGKNSNDLDSCTFACVWAWVLVILTPPYTTEELKIISALTNYKRHFLISRPQITYLSNNRSRRCVRHEHLDMQFWCAPIIWWCCREEGNISTMIMLLSFFVCLWQNTKQNLPNKSSSQAFNS